MKTSAFVITYNGGRILETCLRSLRFVDELIVVDKSSTDGSAVLAARYADTVISVPWSPIPTKERLIAYDNCSHDFILYLDQDECLNVEGIHWLRENVESHPAKIFRFPKKEYILGAHDDRAYYYPSYNVRAFRRGHARFVSKLHLEVEPIDTDYFDIPLETGMFIEHLSYLDTAHWIEKTNRYTSERDRVSFFDTSAPLESFAQERIAFWLAHSRSRSDYVVAVALLRAVYDIVDRIKLWEQDHGADANANFAAVCSALEARLDELDFMRTNMPVQTTPMESARAPLSPADRLRHLMRGLLESVRGSRR